MLADEARIRGYVYVQNEYFAADNGVTQDELVEAITHLAFYTGWPSAVTAVTVAKEVFENK